MSSISSEFDPNMPDNRENYLIQIEKFFDNDKTLDGRRVQDLAILINEGLKIGTTQEQVLSTLAFMSRRIAPITDEKGRAGLNLELARLLPDKLKELGTGQNSTHITSDFISGVSKILTSGSHNPEPAAKRIRILNAIDTQLTFDHRYRLPGRGVKTLLSDLYCLVAHPKGTSPKLPSPHGPTVEL